MVGGGAGRGSGRVRDGLLSALKGRGVIDCCFLPGRFVDRTYSPAAGSVEVVAGLAISPINPSRK